MPDHVVENSYYEHDEHGLVKVIDVTNGVVMMEKQNQHFVAGGKKFLQNAKQSAAGFLDDAEPADITIQADAAVFNLDGLTQ